MRCKTHKLTLKDIATTKGKSHLVYACDLCSHYASIPLSEGKPSICWKCEEELFITTYHITNKIKRPTCTRCKGGKVISDHTIAKLKGSIK